MERSDRMYTEALSKGQNYVPAGEILREDELAVVLAPVNRPSPYNRNGSLTNAEFQPKRFSALVLPGQVIRQMKDCLSIRFTQVAINNSNRAVWFSDWKMEQ